MRLGCVPLFGPHTHNFDDLTRDLVAAGAAGRVVDADDLAATLVALTHDDTARRRMADAGEDWAAAQTNIVASTLEALTPITDLLDAART